MGPCQGRVCDPMRQFLFGSEPERSRAPLFPTAVGLLRDGAELASSTEGVS